MRRLRHGTPECARWCARSTSGRRTPAIVESTVRRILADVRRRGDVALRHWTQRLDGVRLRSLRVPASQVRALASTADPAVVRALRHMAERISDFHRQQLVPGFERRLADGSRLAEVVTPLACAGLYVPGGAGAYPSSVLMNAIPALVAGVPRLTIATPPRALRENPAVAAAVMLVGLEDAVVAIGGAQAIGALAYGTASIAAVAKIVGPGNAWVAEAKRQVRGVVEVPQDAGPSEVVILADDSADPGWVAADLLAQAEHGSGDEMAVLVTASHALAEEVARLVALGVGSVANRTATQRALRTRSAVLLVRDTGEAIAAVNGLAPEHAQIMTRGAARIARQIVAGAVFVGHHSPVAVGDYGIGPNHVLPTGGTARRASALSVRDFERRSSRVQLTEAGLRGVAQDVVCVALAEGFRGHAQSVLTRFAGEP
jgi:histidinol dehydrogenase